MLSPNVQVGALLAVGGVLLSAAAPVRSVPAPPPAIQAAWRPVDAQDEAGLLVADPVDQGRRSDRREVWIDYDALEHPFLRGGEWIAYDLDEVVRPVTAAELRGEPEISLAVRLIISEVGADRLLQSRQALLEAIGILETVDNRLDPVVYDVENRPEAPVFPGCGLKGSFYACANAQQYLGMATWRALSPELRYDPAVLAAAADVAVAAWWLHETGAVEDLTGGATNYVHRCGGAAYGMSTPHCDGHIGNSRRDDVAGANPFTGPIVFRGPSAFVGRRGVYGLIETRRFDYDPWWSVAYVPDNTDALASVEGGGDDVALMPVLVGVEARFSPDPVGMDATGARAVSALPVVADPEAHQRLASWAAWGRW